jgi:hypothetical protein
MKSRISFLRALTLPQHLNRFAIRLTFYRCDAGIATFGSSESSLAAKSNLSTSSALTEHLTENLI